MAGGQFRRFFGFWFVVQSIFPASFLVWPLAWLAVKRRRWVERTKETEAELEKRQKFLEVVAAARAKATQPGTLQKSPTSASQKAVAPVKRYPAPPRTGPERQNSEQTRSQSSPDRDKARHRSHVGTPQKSPGKEKSTSPSRGDTEHDHEDREREM